MRTLLSAEERDQLSEMLEEVCAEVEGTGARADLLRRKLLDAEQAHLPMAREVLLQAELIGLGKVVTDHVKKRATVIVTAGEAKVVRSVVAGIRRRNAEGDEEYQQTMYVDCTWDEVEQMVASIDGMLSSLGIRRKMLRRLRELKAAAPDSLTVGEAVKSLGTTLEAWMEAA